MFKVWKEGDFYDLRYDGREDIPEGNVVMVLTGPRVAAPTRTSIQIAPSSTRVEEDDNLQGGGGELIHIEDPIGQFINHSCHPTVRVSGTHLVSVRTIHRGDSITFDYTTTEEVMACPFVCHCEDCNQIPEVGGRFISGNQSLRK